MKASFVGDIMLGRLVNDNLKKRPAEYLWGNTLPVLQEADLLFGNLECVISDRGQPWSATPKAFHFRTDAKNIESLTKANFKTLSLANNHILDFEYEAMQDTLEILNQAGIKHAGAGATFTEASKPAFLKFADQKIAFIAFTDNDPDWEAADLVPGVFYVPIDRKDFRAQQLFEIVRLAKLESNLVIVSAHWGPNWGYNPLPEHIPFAHALVDQGADIVYGHSPHIFRGIEIYRNKPILYSTGDFVDDYAVDEIERNDQSFIFTIEIQGGQVKTIKLIPTIIDNFQALLAEGDEAQNICLKMQTLSAELDIPLEFNTSENQLSFEISTD